MHKPFVAILLATTSLSISHATAQKGSSKLKVIAFYTERNDLAHISFVHEANKWFPKIAAQNNFIYDSTNDWSKLNTDYLSQYQVVLFFVTLSDVPEQRV